MAKGTPEEKSVNGRRFEEELERRLATLEAPDYEDPARKDLPAVDFAIVAILVFVATVLLYWWGY